MGLKDQEDGTGHILELEYLHLPRGERSAGRTISFTASAEDGSVGPQCSSSDPSLSSSAFYEELSDPEDDPGHTSSNQSTDPSTDPSIDPSTAQRSKLDFALKLGYSEDQVLLVLRKLGPDALTNDLLGELVKFGTRPDLQEGGLSLAAALPPPPLSSLEPCAPLCQWGDDKDNLRPVVVDGSNVAMSHGNKEVFSCQGIQLAVDWFLERGHRDITVFVPAWRKEQSRPDAPISEQEILRHLEKRKILVFTPSRRVQGRRVVCYDDRFIVKLAFESDGIIVSNDNYRDLANEKPEWKRFIDQRLLMYSFVNDKFMPPDDPLGRHGPSLDNFLRKRPVIPEHRRQPCPYGKKCTYGHKCKFYHPERGSQPQRSVADELRASAKISSASRSLAEDSLTGMSQTALEEKHPEPWQSTPKKQSASSSLRGSLSDLCEDRRTLQSRRGSSSSSSSGCSSFLGCPAPPSPGSLDRWDMSAGGSSNSSDILKPVRLPSCDSPEAGYSSMVKAYSGLSLEFPQSLDQFLAVPDPKPESLLSDCSSDNYSNVFSPDLTAENDLKPPPLHKRFPCYTRHGLKEHSQDMPKHYSFPFKESTSCQAASVSTQGRPQDLSKLEYNSFKDGSLLSIAKHSFEGASSNVLDHAASLRSRGLPETRHQHVRRTMEESTSFKTESVCPQGRSQDLPKLEYNSYEDRSLHSIAKHGFRGSPSLMTSLPNVLDPTASPVSSLRSRGLPKTRSQQQQALEESTSSSAMAFANGTHLPSGLSRQQAFQYPEDFPSSVDCHASNFAHFRSELHLQRLQGYQHDYEPSHGFSIPSFVSPKGFSADYHHSVPPKMSPKGFSRGQHFWETTRVQDCNAYNSTFPNNTSYEQMQANWSFHSQHQPYKPYHLFSKNLDTQEETQVSTWGGMSSPKAPLKPFEVPALGQYRETREKLFFNLCGIFPPDLVRLVMARNPHMMDAQELAAAILLAKSQCLT